MFKSLLLTITPALALLCACSAPIDELDTQDETSDADDSLEGAVCQQFDDQNEVFVDLPVETEVCQDLQEILLDQLGGVYPRQRTCNFGSGWGNGLTAQDCSNIINCRGLGQVTFCTGHTGPVTGLFYGICSCSHAL